MNNTVSPAGPGVGSPIPAVLWDIACFIANRFARSELEIAWEGHVQHEVAMFLLQQSWELTFGEPGGANDRIVTVRQNGAALSLNRGLGVVGSSIDLVANKNGMILNLQLKCYPAVGRKSGRAGVEPGLRKDLKAVQNGSCAFIFVADEASYRALRGERVGVRGPKITWHLAIPAFETIPLLSQMAPPVDVPLFGRYPCEHGVRVVCVMWKPDHSGVWRIGPAQPSSAADYFGRWKVMLLSTIS